MEAVRERRDHLRKRESSGKIEKEKSEGETCRGRGREREGVYMYISMYCINLIYKLA